MFDKFVEVWDGKIPLDDVTADHVNDVFIRMNLNAERERLKRIMGTRSLSLSCQRVILPD